MAADISQKVPGVSEMAGSLGTNENGIKTESEDTIQSCVSDQNVEKKLSPDHSSNSTPNLLDGKSVTDNFVIHYEDDVCIYTDLETKYQYVWDNTKQQWVPRSGEKSNENESTKSKDFVFDGESYTYTDSFTGVSYKYDNSKNTWVANKPESKKGGSVESDSGGDDDDDDDAKVVRQDMTVGQYSYDGDTHLYTDPSDGTVYLWDKEKNAWFPKVDDDFLAHYQMSYGFIDPNTTSKPEEKKDVLPEEQAGIKRKATPKEPSWFEMDEQNNTKVYVSNLPLDIKEEEFVNLMQKCGLVMRDVDTGKMKVKIYTEPGSDQPKGDALCTYIKVESVDLALKLLDGCDVRGHKIKVERAKFQMKGDYNPNLKPKKRKKKDKEKIKKMQEKLLDWRPDKLRGERSKHERVVVIKNLFDPKIFDKDVGLILEYQQDLREECSKCGDVRKVVIYDRHAEGVAQVTFREAEEADLCIQLLNGRWFGQRKIMAETWDGKTKYKVHETEEEAQQRLKKWNTFLEAEEQQKLKEKSIDTTSTTKSKIQPTSQSLNKSNVTKQQET